MIIKEKRVTDATIEIIYVRLIKHRAIPDETIKKDWSFYYGLVKNQGPRDICWAIVAVELITAIRWIKNRGKGILSIPTKSSWSLFVQGGEYLMRNCTTFATS
ncbi:unnamed protein product [Brassica rapa subsp. narinosa]